MDCKQERESDTKSQEDIQVSNASLQVRVLVTRLERFTRCARTGAWRRKRHGARRRERERRTCSNNIEYQVIDQKEELLECTRFGKGMICGWGVDLPVAVSKSSTAAKSDGQVKDESLAQLSSDSGDRSNRHLQYQDESVCNKLWRG